MADCLLVAVAGRLQAALSRSAPDVPRQRRGSRWRASAATSSRSCWRTSPTPATRCRLARAASIGAAGAVRHRRPSGVHVRRRRDHRQHDRVRPPRGRAAGCGDRAASREGRGGDAVRAVRSGDARACGGAAADGDGPAPRHRSPGIRGALSADRRAEPPDASAGFEALARWRHPVRGLDQPGGIHSRRRRHRHDSAASDGSSSPNRAGGWPTGRRGWAQRLPSIMCVNVSSRQLAQLDLADEIEAVMRETGLESSWLKLEITESAFITDVWAAEATLRRMQRLGVEWSLDDFGTGYSSLSYLHRLQADTVKVDRSFVSRMGGDQPWFGDGPRHRRARAQPRHGRCRRRRRRPPRSCLSSEAIGCEYAQGFYFSKPVGAVDRRGTDQRRTLARPGSSLAGAPLERVLHVVVRTFRSAVSAGLKACTTPDKNAIVGAFDARLWRGLYHRVDGASADSQRGDGIPHLGHRAAHACQLSWWHADGIAAGGAAGRDRSDDRRHRGAAHHRVSCPGSIAIRGSPRRTC